MNINVTQVPQVTEEAAQAVIELYPTPFFLAKAYSLHVGPLPTGYPRTQATIVTRAQNMCVLYSMSFMFPCYCVSQDTYYTFM